MAPTSSSTFVLPHLGISSFITSTPRQCGLPPRPDSPAPFYFGSCSHWGCEHNDFTQAPYTPELSGHFDNALPQGLNWFQHFAVVHRTRSRLTLSVFAKIGTMPLEGCNRPIKSMFPDFATQSIRFCRYG